MSNLVRENVAFLRHRIRDYHRRILDWQEKCQHEVIQGEYKANTGNWCQQDDSYWIEAECLDCGYRYHADSKTDPKLYHKLSMSGMISSLYDTLEQRQEQDRIRKEIMENRQ